MQDNEYCDSCFTDSMSDLDTSNIWYSLTSFKPLTEMFVCEKSLYAIIIPNDLS